MFVIICECVEGDNISGLDGCFSPTTRCSLALFVLLLPYSSIPLSTLRTTRNQQSDVVNYFNFNYIYSVIIRLAQCICVYRVELKLNVLSYNSLHTFPYSLLLYNFN